MCVEPLKRLDQCRTLGLCDAQRCDTPNLPLSAEIPETARGCSRLSTQNASKLFAEPNERIDLLKIVAGCSKVLVLGADQTPMATAIWPGFYGSPCTDPTESVPRLTDLRPPPRQFQAIQPLNPRTSCSDHGPVSDLSRPSSPSLHSSLPLVASLSDLVTRARRSAPHRRGGTALRAVSRAW